MRQTRKCKVEAESESRGKEGRREGGGRGVADQFAGRVRRGVNE